MICPACKQPTLMIEKREIEEMNNKAKKIETIGYCTNCDFRRKPNYNKWHFGQIHEN